MAGTFTIDRVGDTLHLRGRLGFAAAASAAPRWREFVGQAREIKIDAAGLEQCDSATLAVLLAWAAHVGTAGARLRYCNLPDDLLALARLCGTEHLLLA